MKWVLLLMMLLIPVGVVYGATITPQIEKLPQEVLDYFHDTPGKLANNSQFDAILQEKWDQMAYIISKSTFGLDLPRNHTPDNRDQSLYQNSQNGLCEQEFRMGLEPSAKCEQQVAHARASYSAWQMQNLMLLMQSDPSKWINPNRSPDTHHERAVWCENVEKPQLNMFGNLSWVQDPEDLAMREKLRDAFTEAMLFYMEKNLPQKYKNSMINHINTDTFVDFYTNQTKLTHPDGLNHCFWQ